MKTDWGKILWGSHTGGATSSYGKGGSCHLWFSNSHRPRASHQEWRCITSVPLHSGTNSSWYLLGLSWVIRKWAEQIWCELWPGYSAGRRCDYKQDKMIGSQHKGYYLLIECSGIVETGEGVGNTIGVTTAVVLLTGTELALFTELCNLLACSSNK